MPELKKFIKRVDRSQMIMLGAKLRAFCVHKLISRYEHANFCFDLLERMDFSSVVDGCHLSVGVTERILIPTFILWHFVNSLISLIIDF